MFNTSCCNDIIEYTLRPEMHVSDEKDLLIGEMGELIAALADTKRSDKHVKLAHIVEEMCHVYICLNKTAITLGISEDMIWDAMNEKRKQLGMRVMNYKPYGGG